MMNVYVPSHLKKNNSRVVYDLFQDGNSYSKADISRMTGISAPTVIKIIDSFIEKEILLHAGEGEAAVGRRPNLLKRNEKAFYAFGVDFQDENVRIALVDLNGEIIDYIQMPLRLPLQDMLGQEIVAAIAQMIQRNEVPQQRILGVGLGMPGVVDTQKNTVEYAFTLGMREKTDCTDMLAQLSEKLSVPVFMENDINAAAVGEFKMRRLDKSEDLIYISLGTGLGAGVVLSGELRHGIHHFAGEIAYTSFDEDFPTKEGQLGWLESTVNTADFIKNGMDDSAASCEYMERISKTLALTIANVSVLLDFDLVVVGGLLVSHFGEALLKEIQKNLENMSLLKINCELASSKLPELVGSAIMVCEKRIGDIL
ncbi:MAG: ROK family protein [Christensenella sp.]|uniref:ROK family protein n=1 Tax=Christensenella sp. TaxID=1935934 RepID=UPI002B20D91F|nr:ROK family protein [Christensenella sp.]MEA5004535.1 ROK family protein [Christensenella sp.]